MPTTRCNASWGTNGGSSWPRSVGWSAVLVRFVTDLHHSYVSSDRCECAPRMRAFVLRLSESKRCERGRTLNAR